MGSRPASALLLFALFGAAVFLQVALADDAVGRPGHGDMITASNIDSISTPASEDADPDTTAEADAVDDGQLPERVTVQDGEVEIQPYVYVPEADEVEADSDDVDEPASLASRPLARLLQAKASKDCWSKTKCRKFYSKAGCCRKKCVNLATSNSNCGKCKKWCDTKRGYSCRSGKCVKLQSDGKACTKKKGCKGVSTCCKGKCVKLGQDWKNCGKCGRKCQSGGACCGGKCKKLETDSKNCGKCGRKCPKGDACCAGKCTSLKTSWSNCGKCGRSCGWGRKCCKGKCVSVISNKDNCGRCGKKCAKGVRCIYGICGYGQ